MVGGGGPQGSEYRLGARWGLHGGKDGVSYQQSDCSVPPFSPSTSVVLNLRLPHLHRPEPPDPRASPPSGEAQQPPQTSSPPTAPPAGKPWWQFWGGSPSATGDASSAAAPPSDASSMKPVEAIIIPADLPIEEIAMWVTNAG